MADRADLEERFVSHVDALEKICEEAGDENPELGRRLRERLDAAMPALDDMQDELSRAEPESGEHGESDGE